MIKTVNITHALARKVVAPNILYKSPPTSQSTSHCRTTRNAASPLSMRAGKPALPFSRPSRLVRPLEQHHRGGT
jgi:hypothetical protein